MKRIITIILGAALTFGVALAITSCSKLEPETDSSDFVLLSDVVSDAILEIRYYSTYNFVGKRIDGYQEPVALCTSEAAQALKKASDIFLSKGYRIKVFDAYRPQMSVSHFCRWAADLTDTLMRQAFYPELTKDVLIPQGYILEHSGHSRGSTIDLTLFDMDEGHDVDMGSPFDYFGAVSHADVKPGESVGAHKSITQEQYRMRMLLREVMLSCGFEGIKEEWWHFTLAKEPFPNTYFTFPNTSGVLER